jgi:hypothetical protein
MTKRHINTFSGGIDRDTSVNKYDNTHYYDAENIRPISNNTFTSGAISNVDGLLEKVDFENISVNAPSGSFISNITIYKVIVIRDHLVVFANFSLTILNELDPGKIVDGIITADLVDGEFTNFNIPIYYYDGSSNPLDFHKDMSVVGRYESQNIQKVYWADGVNPLRVANIKRNPSLITPGELDHVPDVTFSNITDLEVVQGGSYTSGVVQYAYQLYNPYGAITTISPVSNPVLLSSLPENEIGGSDIGVDTDKSVRVSIFDLDTRFSRIRVLALFYEELYSNPVVNIVTEQENTGSISFTDTGNSIGTMSYEEFLVFNNTVYSPKSIETKNNILFSANVKESFFRSDILENPDNPNYWDSRAYPFPKNSNNTDIYVDVNSETSVQVSSDTLDTIHHDADALVVNSHKFNTYSAPASITAGGALERTYRPNSEQLGGEGPNIYYEIYSNYNNDPGSWGSDPYLSNTKKTKVSGLQLGEVYRFGIVFYNKKGQVSFVKWIQDIRIPYRTDFDLYTGTGAYNAFVQFTIKPGKEPWQYDTEIAGWQIVRVKRTFEDRELVANGALIPTDVTSGEDFCRPVCYYDSNYPNDYNIGIPLVSDGVSSLYPASTDNPPKLFEFISPEILFNDLEINTNYSVLINYVSEYNSQVIELTVDLSEQLVLGTSGKNLYAIDYDSLEVITKAIPIIAAEKVSPNTWTSSGNFSVFSIGGTDTYSKYRNEVKTGTFPVQSDANNYGIGGTRYVLNLSESLANLEEVIQGLGWSSNETKRLLNVDIIKDVSYTRYGGITYNARVLNTYIPYGSINSTSDNTDSTGHNNYNGDTYIRNFRYLRNMYQRQYPEDWGNNDGLQELINFPVFTSIDLNYRFDKIEDYILKGGSVDTDSSGIPREMMVQETVELGLKYQPTVYDESIGDLYTYNSVYSKENEAKKFYPKPFDFVDQSTIDTKIIASEVKTNGEYIDSWTLLKPNNFIEVESEYGPIVKLKRFMNNLLCFQPEGVSLLAVNDRSLINDGSGVQLALGTGGVLERYDYISNGKGISNPNALVASKQALYFIDEYNKELWMLQGANSQELSRIKGFSSKINSLIPSTKILAGFDPNFNEIYFSFDNETWVLNEILGSVIGKFSVNPSNYFNLKGKFYSITNNILSENNNPNSKLGDKSYITLLINPNSNIINSFDNLDFRTEVSLNNNTGYIKGIKLDYTISEATQGDENYIVNTNTLIDYNDDELIYINLAPKITGELTRSLVITYTGPDLYSSEPLLFKLKTLNLQAIGADVSDIKVYVTGDLDSYKYVTTVPSVPETTTYSVDFTPYTPNFNFDNFGTVDRIIYENSYIDPITKATKLSDPGKTVSYLARAFRTQVPQTQDGNRFVDSYLLVTFEFDNIDNLNFKLHDVISYYREAKI